MANSWKKIRLSNTKVVLDRSLTRVDMLMRKEYHDDRKGNMTELMTLKEVADYLRVTEKTVYRLLGRGVIPATKVGHQWRFAKASIVEWLQRKSVGGKGT